MWHRSSSKRRSTASALHRSNEKHPVFRVLGVVEKLWFFDEQASAAQSALDEECPESRINERFRAFCCVKSHAHVATFYWILCAPWARETFWDKRSVWFFRRFFVIDGYEKTPLQWNSGAFRRKENSAHREREEARCAEQIKVFRTCLPEHGKSGSGSLRAALPWGRCSRKPCTSNRSSCPACGKPERPAVLRCRVHSMHVPS